MKFISLARNVLALFLLYCPLAFSSPFDNPYQGNIVVQEQTENSLKVLALKQVLAKVSGNVDIAKLAESKLLLNNAQRLLSQYGYQTINNTRYFTAVFDSYKINQALKEMQQPVWGDTRPNTLVWLILDTARGRQLVSDNMLILNADPSLSSAFLEQQHHRGISLQFPLMDLEDNLALSISDVSGRFYGAIASASQRYAVEHFIVAHLKQESLENWFLSWQLIKSDLASKRNKVLISDKLSGQKTELVSSMVSKIADYYASQYAVLDNAGEQFSQTIYIDGIRSLAQLTQLNNVLANLQAIESFEITSVAGAKVTVNIKINGGLHSFKNGLFAQPNLQPDLSHSEEFYFNWR